MSISACGVCGSTDLKPICGTQMTECTSCTVQYPSETPLSGVVTNQLPVSPSGKGSFLARSQARIALKYRGNRGVMDIGCGNGSFLYALSQLQKQSFSISGVELDPSSIVAARAAGIEVHESVPAGTNNVLVTMWHVAEHFHVRDLQRLLNELNDDHNLLLISVPNGHSVSWKRYGERFSFYDAESHMVQYTPDSLERLLDSCNWKVLREIRTPTYGAFNAIQTGINLWRPHNELYNLLKRRGGSLSISLAIKTGIALAKSLIPVSRMILAEFNSKRSSTYTILAESRRP
jgi:hypothetical protein